MSASGLSFSAPKTDLALVESMSLDLSLLLKAVDHILVAPSDLVRETLKSTNTSLACNSYSCQ
jgi:hypothetical protein